MEKLVAELWKANMRHPQASEVMNKEIRRLNLRSYDGWFCLQQYHPDVCRGRRKKVF
ncbi:unnamed protein product, partial [Linum tenue]